MADAPRDTAAKSKKSGSSASAKTPPTTDAISLLEQDHRAVEALFEQFEETEDTSEQQDIAREICAALKVHTQIEEEIFYPAARGEAEDDTLDEAQVEHDGAKKLIAEIEASSPDEPLFKARVKVLSEYVKHHVREEETELFTQVEESDLDLDELGARLAARKGELEKRSS